MATNAQFIQFGPYFSAGVQVTSLNVYHYTAGTLTLQNVWTDRAKSSTAAQPVQSDANGIVSFYADGLYKFKVTSGTPPSDSTLYTYDNVAVSDIITATQGEGAALTAASTLTLGTDGNQFHVTGSTGITALSGTQPEVTLIFDSTPTLTDSGNLILRGNANYTCVAGDVLRFMNEGSGVWREVGPRQGIGDASITDRGAEGGLVATGYPQDFRLSLTTAVPVTTSDVTAAETLYCVPYVGNRIALYNGTRWNIRTSAEFTIDVPDVTQVHDVFCYDNSGVPTLEVLAWTNDTTRATALAYQNGVLVKSGDATRRYLGSFYATTAGNGQVEDSLAKRNLWNYYHRVARPMKVVEGTDSWTYSTGTIRQARATATNQLEYVQGVSEDAVYAQVLHGLAQDTAGHGGQSGIGVDSTTVNSATLSSGAIVTHSAVGNHLTASAFYRGFPGVGRHTLVWLECATGAGNTTWYGDTGTNMAAATQYGISGEVWG